jgi:heavy metal translocating P-type ATPase
VLFSDAGFVDESSLTGEPYPIEKILGDKIRSGTVNMGNPMVITVTKTEADSTYRKIIQMVQNAQSEKAPLVRLADKYSTVFTIISLALAGFAYVISSGDLSRVLSVLVIATPCPLILATPIALLGGVNASAKNRIIVKRLAALEILSRVNTIIFDKTGTITLGKPVVTAFQMHTKTYDEQQLLAIAEAIERNSLHPLAKAVVTFAKEKQATILHAENIQETIGKGISGIVKNKTYTLSKILQTTGMTIGLYEKNTLLATILFTDEVKKDAKDIISHLQTLGLHLSIFTGDKKAAAETVAKELGANVTIRAECTPEDKKTELEILKKQGKIVAMVGDGINDAPALARADVGMVFSNEEQTAASEAADIVFLGGDFSQVYTALRISKQTIRVALTSIFVGIGLALVGMGFASVGYIPPLIGAIMQEVIDVVAIVNALRASRAH